MGFCQEVIRCKRNDYDIITYSNLSYQCEKWHTTNAILTERRCGVQSGLPQAALNREKTTEAHSFDPIILPKLQVLVILIFGCQLKA